MNVELKDVSTYMLIQFAKGRASFDLVYQEIYNFLIINNVFNYQVLNDKLMDTNLNLSFSAIGELRSKLENVIERVSFINSNSQISELPIFTFDIYNSAKIDIDTCNITDKSVFGTSLIHRSPTYAVSSGIECYLGKHSILEIKHLLGFLTIPEFRNGLTILNPVLKLDKIRKYAGAVCFYEQQVVRQYLETKKLGVNVFDLNFSSKYQLVSEYLSDIVDYFLMVSNDESVWCSMTEVQRKKFRQIAYSTLEKGFNIPYQKNQLITEIANYTTLGELENDICFEQDIPVVTDNGILYVRDVPIKRFTRALEKR